MSIQGIQEFIKGFIEFFQIDMCEIDSMELNKSGINQLSLLRQTIGSENRIEKCENALPSRRERLAHSKTFAVVKQLLKDVGAC